VRVEGGFCFGATGRKTGHGRSVTSDLQFPDIRHSISMTRSGCHRRLDQGYHDARLVALSAHGALEQGRYAELGTDPALSFCASFLEHATLPPSSEASGFNRVLQMRQPKRVYMSPNDKQKAKSGGVRAACFIISPQSPRMSDFGRGSSVTGRPGADGHDVGLGVATSLCLLTGSMP
jgi:hypothetical protein